MTNPTTLAVGRIPTQDLLADRRETIEDIAVCEHALTIGVTRYGGSNHDENSTQERLDANKKILRVIDLELKRRNIQVVEVGAK